MGGSMGHLWLQFRPIPFSVFGDQVSPHVHHERTTLKGVRASTLKRLLRAPFFTRAVSFARTSNAFYRTDQPRHLPRMTSIAIEFGTPLPFYARRKATIEDGSPEGTLAEGTPGLLRRMMAPSSPPPAVGSKQWLKSRGPVLLSIVIVTTVVCVAALKDSNVSHRATVSGPRKLDDEVTKKPPLAVAALTSAVVTLNGGHAQLEKEVAALTNAFARLEKEVIELRGTLLHHEAIAEPVPAQATRRPSPFVTVWFIYDASDKLGASVDLFWLAANKTERLYARVPAGQRVEELTQVTG